MMWWFEKGEGCALLLRSEWRGIREPGGLGQQSNRNPQGGGAAGLNWRTNFLFENRIHESHAGQLGLIKASAGLLADRLGWNSTDSRIAGEREFDLVFVGISVGAILQRPAERVVTGLPSRNRVTTYPWS